MATASDSDTETPLVEMARDVLQDAIQKAAAMLTDLLDVEDKRVQIRAAEAILDRAGLTKAKRTSTTMAKEDISGEVPDYKKRGLDLNDLL